MSSTTNSEATINAFVNAIHPDLDYVLTITAFSACLFTLFVVLVALSTKESRRRLAFRLNVLAIGLALTTSILAGLTSGKPIVDPFNSVSTSVFIASVAFVYFPPLLYDSVLLTRLFALYPLSSTPPITLLKIFAFPSCVKCARVVVISLLVNDCVRAATTTEAVLLDQSTLWFRNPYLIAEWTMQIADNMYSVSFFLYNLHVRARPLKSEGDIPDRIRQIFFISAANFVFPLVFNIALLIIVVTDHPPNTGAGLLVLINNYVTVIGVLCATLWFSRSEWAQPRNEPLSDEMLRRRLDMERAPVNGGMGGSGIVVIGTRAVTLDLASLDREAPTNSKQLTPPKDFIM